MVETVPPAVVLCRRAVLSADSPIVQTPGLLRGQVGGPAAERLHEEHVVPEDGECGQLAVGLPAEVPHRAASGIGPDHALLATSQTQMLVSDPAVARRLPSGEKVAE